MATQLFEAVFFAPPCSPDQSTMNLARARETTGPAAERWCSCPWSVSVRCQVPHTHLGGPKVRRCQKHQWRPPTAEISEPLPGRFRLKIV